VETQAAQGLSDLRQTLANRALAPLNLVLTTRELIQETMDDAVERGRMTRSDAEDLVFSLARLGRKQGEDVISDLEQLIGRGREQIEAAATDAAKRVADTGKRARGSAQADRALREVDRARRVVGVGSSFPILGYDDLTAAQITDRFGDLTPAQLRKVRDYERRHANRKSVLQGIERALDQ
jgi:polyhydroxyalkanoate synthesis regulator phasin